MMAVSSSLFIEKYDEEAGISPVFVSSSPPYLRPRSPNPAPVAIFLSYKHKAGNQEFFLA